MRAEHSSLIQLITIIMWPMRVEHSLAIHASYGCPMKVRDTRLIKSYYAWPMGVQYTWLIYHYAWPMRVQYTWLIHHYAWPMSVWYTWLIHNYAWPMRAYLQIWLVPSNYTINQWERGISQQCLNISVHAQHLFHKRIQWYQRVLFSTKQYTYISSSIIDIQNPCDFR